MIEPNPLPLLALPSTERIVVEDLLRALLECEYRGHEATEAHLTGLSGVVREASVRGLALGAALGVIVETRAGTWGLTESGRLEAVRIMRAHRLTETQLARESGLPPDRWHEHAHREEHRLTSADVNALADRLGNPRFDPHGDPIPTREGRLPEAEDVPIWEWPADVPGVIAHVEDEPREPFARITALGLVAGLRFVARPTEGGVELVTEGRNLRLPRELAPLVRVRALHPEEREVEAGAMRLSDLPDMGVAEVVKLLPSCAGSERSRLLDLGFVPGSRIERVLNSPLHGPVAYRVRGTLIALRRTQADHVLVRAGAPAESPL